MTGMCNKKKKQEKIYARNKPLGMNGKMSKTIEKSIIIITRCRPCRRDDDASPMSS